MVAKLWCHKLCAIFWTTMYIHQMNPVNFHNGSTMMTAP